jgi:hypothetical protein
VGSEMCIRDRYNKWDPKEFVKKNPKHKFVEFIKEYIDKELGGMEKTEDENNI